MKKKFKARYFYDKRKKDHVMKWDEGCKAGAIIFHNFLYSPECAPDIGSKLGYQFLESAFELFEKAGFDLKTLKCEIELKKH